VRAPHPTITRWSANRLGCSTIPQRATSVLRVLQHGKPRCVPLCSEAVQCPTRPQPDAPVIPAVHARPRRSTFTGPLRQRGSKSTSRSLEHVRAGAVTRECVGFDKSANFQRGEVQRCRPLIRRLILGHAVPEAWWRDHLMTCVSPHEGAVSIYMPRSPGQGLHTGQQFHLPPTYTLTPNPIHPRPSAKQHHTTTSSLDI
jgi:hypothetical protein